MGGRERREGVENGRGGREWREGEEGGEMKMGDEEGRGGKERREGRGKVECKGERGRQKVANVINQKRHNHIRIY